MYKESECVETIWNINEMTVYYWTKNVTLIPMQVFYTVTNKNWRDNNPSPADSVGEQQSRECENSGPGTDDL